jgi:hypothetical protein
VNGPTISAGLFALVATGVTAGAIVRRRPFLDNPGYWAFCSYVLFVGIGPLFVDFLNPNTLVMRLSFDPGVPALVLSWVGLAALVSGYSLAKSWETRSGRNRGATPQVHNGDSSVLLIGGVAWTLLAIMGTAAYLQRVGGIDYFFQTAYGTREDASIFAIFYDMFQPGLYLILAWALASKVKSKLVWAVVLVYVCFDLLWFGPIRGGRNETVTLVLTLACLVKNLSSRERTGAGPVRRWWLLAAGAAIVLIWGGIRSNSIQDLISGASGPVNLASTTQDNVARSLYATYQGFVGIVNSVPNVVPYQWGRTLFESATLVVPRAIWPDKPEPASSWLAREFYGQRVLANMSTTWPGELYLDFGWVGLAFGMFGTGCLCAWLARLRMIEHAGRQTVWMALFGAVWLPFPFLLIWTGSYRAVWHIFSNIVPIWIVGKAAWLSPVRRESVRAAV